MFTRMDADNILNEINEANLTDAEFASVDTSKEIYNELAKVLHSRGGVSDAFERLRILAAQNGIAISNIPFNEVFIGAVL